MYAAFGRTVVYAGLVNAVGVEGGWSGYVRQPVVVPVRGPFLNTQSVAWPEFLRSTRWHTPYSFVATAFALYADAVYGSAPFLVGPLSAALCLTSGTTACFAPGSLAFPMGPHS